ncbi:hypothetical protein PR202_gb14506 [Eleusine coracana subsp. coracana]|uniref:RBR-type E3 ubiquitin transferase n=1 Tax=Eleusine coracana subsp. coracana TaxID=191504 RepID=A0AAV5EWI4_ELECO|nr:hypothetical protein PR202_gb14506 [Eleusine coracana subsp. coracana]
MHRAVNSSGLREKQNRTGTSVHGSTRAPLYGRTTRRGGVLARFRGIQRGRGSRQMESTRGEREPSPEEAESKEVGMLRKMMLQDSRQGEEPQVSDEQLRSNDQRQQDEVLLARVLAMEAIYGDNICNFSEKAGLRSFQIHVHCEVPDGISVSAELFQGGDHDTDSRIFHTFRVQHLARISITCLMPLSYPSHQPPFFTLHVQWLDGVKVSSLCHMLDLIWAQQPGQEVVYEWVQWLQNSVLSHLGFGDGIVIRQFDSDSMMASVDVRAVGEIISVESIVHWLISYNEEQCHESFLSGFHDCMICLSEYAGIDFIKLPCGHYFCWRCMETYSRMHVKDGTVLKLLCPDAKCQGGVPPNLLKRLLGDADFERWERLILQKTLDSMADVSYCPRCETACLEDEENNAQCSKCFFSFCTLCRDRRHIGKKCVFLTPEEKLLSSWEREKLHRLSKGDSDKTVYLAKEMLSIKEVLRSSVPCPHCGTAISRVSGCNHMICRRCGKAFCYGCGDLGCNGCGKNRSTDPTQLDVISFLGEETQKETHKQPTLQESSRQHPCPNCHQPNPKVMYHSFQMSHELVLLLLL